MDLFDAIVDGTDGIKVFRSRGFPANACDLLKWIKDSIVSLRIVLLEFSRE
jgi:hypothetical protein